MSSNTNVPQIKGAMMDTKSKEALQRLSNNTDFQLYLKHLEAEQELATRFFTQAPASDIFQYQGRVQAYNHIIGTIKNVKE